jgi:hypothetical protein
VIPISVQYWSSIHTVEWWKEHWQKTGLVDVQCAQFLPESDRLLRNYWVERPLDQDKDPIMRAVPNDDERLIGLFCLVARKRWPCDWVSEQDKYLFVGGALRETSNS